jgi:hypothetical protein
MQVDNSIGSNPELSRGLAAIYADLRKQMQANDGQLAGGLSKSFTSADGLVTLSVSTIGLAAYAGTRTENGDTIRAEDVGILLESKSRSGTGADAATSTGTASSEAIRNLDDLQGFELRMQQSMSVTEFIDRRGQDVEALPQPGDALAGNDLAQGLTAAGLDLSDALQQRQADANRLIDTLTAFLQGLKGNTGWTPQAESAAANQSETTRRDITRRETTITQRVETTSLFLRVDVTA